MRPSEAMLRAIDGHGGPIDGLQFSSWFTELVKRGYVEKDYDADPRGWHYRISEKGRRYLETLETGA